MRNEICPCCGQRYGSVKRLETAIALTWVLLVIIVVLAS